MRQTVESRIEFRGNGLHGGQPVHMQIAPAPAGHGIVFLRSDLPADAARIPARFDLVNDTRLCTKLTNAYGASVSTVEHLMAALAGAGVSDALILIDGPEVPILDGSSLLFTRALARAGLRRLTVKQPAIRVLKPVVVEDGGRTARLLPLADDAISSLEVTFEIRFDDPAIGQQKYGLRITPDAFAEELAECRTFCHLAEVEGLRKIGLARGGGLDNAIVVDRGRVLNPEGLRRPDEFVRHKMLDAVGDLALAGAPIIGRYEGVLAGHEMTNRLLHALFEAEESWEWVDHQPLIRTARRPYTLRPGEGAALAV